MSADPASDYKRMEFTAPWPGAACTSTDPDSLHCTQLHFFNYIYGVFNHFADATCQWCLCLGQYWNIDWLTELGFNDTSTLVGHFVSSPREREKRDRRDSRGDEREGQGRKRNRNESEETEEIKTFPSTLTCYKASRPCPAVSQYQLDAPVT